MNEKLPEEINTVSIGLTSVKLLMKYKSMCNQNPDARSISAGTAGIHTPTAQRRQICIKQYTRFHTDDLYIKKAPVDTKCVSACVHVSESRSEAAIIVST